MANIHKDDIKLKHSLIYFNHFSNILIYFLVLFPINVILLYVQHNEYIVSAVDNDGLIL